MADGFPRPDHRRPYPAYLGRWLPFLPPPVDIGILDAGTLLFFGLYLSLFSYAWRAFLPTWTNVLWPVLFAVAAFNVCWPRVQGRHVLPSFVPRARFWLLAHLAPHTWRLAREDDECIVAVPVFVRAFTGYRYLSFGNPDCWLRDHRGRLRRGGAGQPLASSEPDFEPAQRIERMAIQPFPVGALGLRLSYDFARVERGIDTSVPPVRGWRVLWPWRAWRRRRRVRASWSQAILLPGELGHLLHANVRVLSNGYVDVSGLPGPRWLRLAAAYMHRNPVRALVEISPEASQRLRDPARRAAALANRMPLFQHPQFPISLHLITRRRPLDDIVRSTGPESDLARDTIGPWLIQRRCILTVAGRDEAAVDVAVEVLMPDLADSGLRGRVLLKDEVDALADDAWGEARSPALTVRRDSVALETGLVRELAGSVGQSRQGVQETVTFVVTGLREMVGLDWALPFIGGTLHADVALFVRPRWTLWPELQLSIRRVWWSAFARSREYALAADQAQAAMEAMAAGTGSVLSVGLYVTVPVEQRAQAESALRRAVGIGNFFVPHFRAREARASTEPFGRDLIGQHMTWTSDIAAATNLSAASSIWPTNGDPIFLGVSGLAPEEPVGWDPVYEGDMGHNGAVIGDVGSGKRLALDTPLATPTGWTSMGEVQVGDRVFDERGQPCRVSYVSPVHLGDSYRVVFSDGSVIVADAEHLWSTWTLQARTAKLRRVDPKIQPHNRSHRRTVVAGPEVRTTAQIAATLRSYNGSVNHSIENALPLQLPIGELPVPPYTLGAWLGDGRSASAHLTSADPEILDHIRADGVSVMPPVVGDHSGAASTFPLGEREPRFSRSGKLSWEAVQQIRSTTAGQGSGRALARSHGVSEATISLVRRLKIWQKPAPEPGLQSTLRCMGLLHNKHVPSIYLRAGVSQRLALLQGLMDTDGNVSTGQAEFTSTNVLLADGVYELVVSLGMKATRHDRPAMLDGVAHGTAYRIAFTPTMPVFRLGRKAAGIRFDVAQQSKRTRRYIVAVEPVAPVPMRCIAVDTPNHLYLAGSAMVPTHNTNLAFKCMRQYLRPHPSHTLTRLHRRGLVLYWKDYDEWGPLCEDLGALHLHVPGPPRRPKSAQLLGPRGEALHGQVVGGSYDPWAWLSPQLEQALDEDREFVALNLIDVPHRMLNDLIPHVSDWVKERQRRHDHRAPFLYWMDEAWIPAQTEEGALHIQQMALQSRADFIIFIVCTQFLHHLYGTRAFDAVRTAVFRVFFRLGPTEREAMAREFALGQTALDLLAQVDASADNEVPMRGRGIIQAHGRTGSVQVVRLGVEERLFATNPLEREAFDRQGQRAPEPDVPAVAA